MKLYYLIPTILGACVMFAWMLFGDLIFPWRCLWAHTFPEPEKVIEAFQSSSVQSGLYIYPAQCGKGSFQEELFIFASVKKSAPLASWIQYTIGFAGYFLIALFTACGLGHLKSYSYVNKLGIIALFGVILILFIWLPEYLRFRIPMPYLLMQMKDLLISWILAGAVMALFFPESHKS